MLYDLEPAMDDLISAVFGDDSIFLSCNSGECLHYTMVPGFKVCEYFDFCFFYHYKERGERHSIE